MKIYIMKASLMLVYSSDFPNKMLNWHYRSRDESLIAFSNYHFYNNRLITFPNPNLESHATGLKLVYVPDGVYKRGAGARHNLTEANKVVELVHEHLVNTPELTLGIVALSVSQRRVIEMAIEKFRKEHPELDPLFSSENVEPVFIKNLENVQGDERDVIILSIGYGKDETGKMTLNFGPINREGGARRLNVAVTRARYSLKLVTSIKHVDIDLSRVNSEGANLLRNYLEVAQNGGKAVYKDEKIYSDSEFDSSFEESVFNELTRRGIKIIHQVGVSKYCIDLAVINPDQPGHFLLGIECDGAMYHSAVTARDRDRLRQEILEGLGWSIYRIWSRDWIQNRSNEIEKIFKAIEIQKQEFSTPRLSSSIKKKEPLKLEPLNAISEDTFNENKIPPGAIPYKRQRLQRQPYMGGYALLNTPTSRLVEAFKAIVEAEGPIPIEVAKRRVVEAWDTRKGSNIDLKLEYAISDAKRKNIFVVKGNFLWPTGMTMPPLRIHKTGQQLRSVDDIAPEEIMMAVRECVKSALGITYDDLVRETLKLFGLHTIQDNSIHVGEIIDQMITQYKLKSEKEKITKGKKF